MNVGRNDGCFQKYACIVNFPRPESSSAKNVHCCVPVAIILYVWEGNKIVLLTGKKWNNIKWLCSLIRSIVKGLAYNETEDPDCVRRKVCRCFASAQTSDPQWAATVLHWNLCQVTAIIANPPGSRLRNFCMFSGDKDEWSSKAEEHSMTVISLKLQLRHAIENIIGTSPVHSL